MLESVAKPVTDDEAAALAQLFGPGDCFGLAWTLVHLVESAPRVAPTGPTSTCRQRVDCASPTASHEGGVSVHPAVQTVVVRVAVFLTNPSATLRAPVWAWRSASLIMT